MFSAFRREQIRIQINHLGFLMISGERPLDGTRWKRFKKEFEIPKYCNQDAIHGNFTQNILSVVMPKKIDLIPQEEEQDDREIPELEEDYEEEQEIKKPFRKVKFSEGRGTTEKTTKVEDYADTREDNDDVGLIVETTREVALKFMVVIIVIWVIVSYLVDMTKSFMAQAQSYFHD